MNGRMDGGVNVFKLYSQNVLKFRTVSYGRMRIAPQEVSEHIFGGISSQPVLSEINSG